MHAIGNQVIAQFPRKRVVYATSEKFTNEFITSIQQGKIDEFRARYRRIDLLLIDDIQFIADKERTQEEFFHTFNAIHEDGKQIVLSSRPAAEGDPDPRGAPAQPVRVGPHRRPDRARTSRRGSRSCGPRPRRARSRSPRTSIEFIARKVVSATSASSRARSTGSSPTRAWAPCRSASSSPRPSSRTSCTTPRSARSRRSGSPRPSSDYYSVPMDALQGQKRDKAIVMPRQIAMFLMREETDVSLLRIGAELGGRDHSTVLHACDKITREVAVNDELRREIAAVRELIYAD